jgi:hypothetical protein
MLVRSLIALALLASSPRADADPVLDERLECPPPVPWPPPVRDEKRNYELMAAGLAAFGTFYSFDLFGGVPDGQAWLALPVAGALRLAAGPQDGWFPELTRTLLIVDGVMQAGGIVMTIAGATTKRRVRMPVVGP